MAVSSAVRSATLGKLLLLVASLLVMHSSSAEAQPAPGSTPRIVHADVVALDQMLVYNRFGSHNPFGMMFALRRDVSAASSDPSKQRPDADSCSNLDGTEAGEGQLVPGRVMLKPCKRPRPLVLRGNVGDILQVTVTNLLRPDQPNYSADDQSGSVGCRPESQAGKGADRSSYPPARFCREGIHHENGAKAPTRCDIRTAVKQECAPKKPNKGKTAANKDAKANDDGRDWPRTRTLSFAIPGLESLPIDGEVHGACQGIKAVKPGEAFTCRWRLDREGTHLFSSLAAPGGGQADGGSLMHGLFGGLIVQASNATYYRSQVTKAAFGSAWPAGPAKIEGTNTPVAHARSEALGYSKTEPDKEASSRQTAATGALKFNCGSREVPILSITRTCSETLTQAGIAGRLPVVEIVHGDLNAIIVPGLPRKSIDDELAVTTDEDRRTHLMLEREKTLPFREFTVIFHDELKTFYTDHFRELEQFDQLSGVRDGFAINYGASGAGSLVLANRKQIGPAANCPECMYEEFFLESWASGDPALLEAFPDDPSNVHHSYLNDKVVFRNFHAGKETHVFHLHAHQWMAGNDLNRGGYLDSQTIGPQQGLTYRIYHGGLDRYAPANATGAAKGWWESLGSGNRNRTIGDSIFHCHLYPHFAQGMWALWRVHDVLEDGTRLLPDGQEKPGLSLAPQAQPGTPRSGSVKPDGTRVTGPQGSNIGTPIPGLIPLPDAALPLLPTYGADGMPGYPFYIAGSPGHRAPQPPLDMAVGADGKEQNGGLPRHVVTAGVAVPSVQKKLEKMGASPVPADKLVAAILAVGDVTSKFEWLTIKPLDQAGELLEKNAMAFHYNGRKLDSGNALNLRNAFGAVVTPPAANAFIAYPSPSLTRTGTRRAGESWFAVNGAPPAPGAPFSDPCGVPAGLVGSQHRRVTSRPATSGQPAGQEMTTAVAFNATPDHLRRNTPPFVGDPALKGFRRYEASVIQFDMVVNRAGWHDPQARINVLTEQADDWKLTKRSDAEPFFFRAFSGECIEFRHTNETPKDLELDDFQLKVPTDIIGQHIHLVKFDVTSADGSGNGFNYEDGTFAPDEILARICAVWKAGKGFPAGVANREKECREHDQLETAYYTALKSGDEGRIAATLAALKKAELWRRSSRKEREFFQTTVQRWFADPILSNDGEKGIADRTLRTVFTHDHFAPSNIQQHGFYNALLIEPHNHVVCLNSRPERPAEHVKQFTSPSAPTTCVGETTVAGSPVLSKIDPRDLIGTRASILAQGTPDPIHPDTREYAIAIADFATLYDGAKNAKFVRGIGKAEDQGEIDGLRRLYLEAAGRGLKEHGEDAEKSVPPASVHRPHFHLGRELAVLGQEIRHLHGYPIAAPPRPEAISQKHHDPYLVNYRNEPIPLRIGAKSQNGKPVDPRYLANPCHVAVETGGRQTEHHKDIQAQRHNRKGDMGHVFRSAVHGDPCTPIIEVYEGEEVQIRLIQGAQEVQHTFMIEGHTFPRNKDQAFPAARMGVGHTAHGTRADNCNGNGFAGSGGLPSFGESGRPRQFYAWATDPNFPRRTLPETDPGYPGTPHAHWTDFARHAAGCTSPMGLVSANEMGISEHFEVGGRFGSALNATAASRAMRENSFSIQAASRQSLRWGLRRTATGNVVLGVEEANHPITRDAYPAIDTLYHFGSQDALWNGAFGLVRLYDMPRDRQHIEDVAQCFQGISSNGNLESCWKQTSLSISDRLPELAKLRAVISTDLGTKVPPSAASSASPARPVRPSLLLEAATATEPVCRVERPLGTSGFGWREGTRVVVAAHAEEIWPDHFANKHGGNRIFDPNALVLVELNDHAWFFKDGEAGVKEVTRAEEAARRTRSEIVAHLNQQMKQEGRAPSPLVLRAKAGDCLVVWLVNALKERPANTVGTIHDTPGDALMPKIVPLNVERFNGARNSNPSANVALSIPLPVFSPTGQQTVALPFGINGGDDERQVGPAEADDKHPRMRATRYLAQWIRPQNLPDLTERRIVQLGTPYAYGVLPIRPIGDVIGHAAHGMYGSIIIEPSGGTVKPEPSDRVTYSQCHGDKGCRIEHPEIKFASAPPSHLNATSYAPIPGTTVREHVLTYQDGLNLWSQQWNDSGKSSGPHPLPNCPACDDSYDLGEKGANYRTEPFNRRLAGNDDNPDSLGLMNYPDDKTNLNQHRFPSHFFSHTYRPVQTPRLQAKPGEEMMVRVVHPSGRARQRAFVLYGAGYYDMFPGFGSANAALLAPGKAITASFCAPKAAGEYLWRDGPQHIFAAGVWGQLHVVDDAGNALGRQCVQ